MHRMNYSFILQGSKVEVSSNEDGYQNAWFSATVLDPPAPAKTPSPRTRPKRMATVMYDHMLSDDTGEPLVEKLKLALIRPIPPEDDPPAALEPYDVVDVYYNEVWWTGYVVGVDDGIYTVAFKSPPDVLEVGRSELRPHWDWVDACHWVRPTKESTSFFSPAMQVELDPTKDNPGTTWLPAVYLGEDGCDGLHTVKYKSSDDGHLNDFQKIQVHIDQIRPCPPIVKKKDFDLLEKVDALFGFRWNVGVITKIVVGKRYTVSFRHLNKEVEFDYSEIRPHMDWIDGQWVSKLKRKLSRVEVGENDNQGTTSAEKRETPSKSEFGTFSRLSTRKRNRSPESKFQSPQSSARGTNVVPCSELEEVNNENSEFLNADAIEEVADKRICEPVVQECDPKASDEETFEPIMDDNAVRAADKKFDEPNDDFEGSEFLDTGVGPEDVIEAGAESDNNGMRCETNQEYEHPDMTTQNLQAQKEIDNETSKAVSGVEDCTTEEQETSVLACSEYTGNETSEVVVSIGELLTLVSPCSKATGSQDQVSPVSIHVSADGRLGTEETNSTENANDSVGLVMTCETEGPFVHKRHRVWSFLESMDVFHKLPQSPHFRPLLKYAEKEREGLAIGSMVNYANLMAKISVLQPSDSTQHIDSLISQLGGYAELGFDVNTVQGRLNIWSNTKAEIERLKAERKGITSRIKECIEEKARINEEFVAVNHRISELSRKRAALAQVRMKQRAKLVKSSLEAEAIRIDLESARERSRNLLASIIPR